MTMARKIADGEYYHVFNRGAHRQTIFRDQQDRLRFLFLVLYLQSPHIFFNTGRIVRAGSLEGFTAPSGAEEEVLQTRFVEVTAFCLMPNHFHLLLKAVTGAGVSEYLQRVAVAYTKYFNEKYTSTGSIFGGRYKAVHVKDNRQLLYLSAYIHRNPRELKDWKEKEESYPYSSLQDYVDKNRWGGLLATDIIASQFDGTTKSNYRDFVRTSTAKIIEEETGIS
jgi:putative transposase